MSQRLNSRHFQIFTAVMHSDGLTEAAFKLGLSKPAISKTLRLIERETGVVLFRLERGRLEPTAAAHRLLPRAEQLSKQAEWTLEEAYSLHKDASQTVVVAAHAPPLIAILPLAIEHFEKSHPEVNVRLRIEEPAKVLELVSHHEVDLGVTNTPSPEASSGLNLCERRTLSEDLLVVAMHRRHPLVARQVVRAEDLAEHNVLGLLESSPTSVLVRAALQEVGIPTPKRIVASTSLGVCALIQQNVGVGLINPLLLSTGIFPDLVTRPFRPRITLRTEIYHSSIRPLSAPAQALATSIQAAAANLHGHAMPAPARR